MEKLPLDFRKKKSLSSLLLEARIDPQKPIPEPPVILKIGESVVFSAGEISMVIGKAKSRKTFLIALFIASMTKIDENHYIKGVPCSDKYNILFFDTEQGDYYASRTIKRIMQMVDDERKVHVIGYRLRKHAPKDRLAMIEYAIQNTDHLLAVVIDGVRDLAFDINSPSEATEIASNLLRWSEEKQIHVCTILHQNKSDENARGHLGTELVNKSESVISVKKIQGNNTSLVHAEYNRGLDFPDFEIAINPDGTPFISNFNATRKEVDEVRRPSADDYKKIAENIFSENTKLDHSKFTDALKQALREQKLAHSDKPCRAALVALEKLSLIETSKEGKSKFYSHAKE